MKNYTIKIMDDNQAQVSKTFAKNAKIYGTEEYKLWREFLAENPGYTMTTKTIKKNPDKRTNKNLKYENMRQFIKEQDNYLFEEMTAIDSLQKKDIRKKLAEASKRLEALQRNYPKREKEIREEAQTEIESFNQSQAIRPVLLINIVLKF